MEKFLIKKLITLEKRYKKIESMLIKTSDLKDKRILKSLSKEYTKLKNIYFHFKKWKKIQKEILTIQQFLLDPEMKKIAEEELIIIQKKSNILKEKLKLIIIDDDPNNSRNCYLEIYAGTGGKEAALFVSDLLRMYIKYAEIKKWKVEIVNRSYNESHGYKDVIINIKGLGVYGDLKFESGGHRVQRIPETESQGRVHTSTCTVAVFPEIPKEKLPKIDLSDLKIDTFRASGAGGQHVNTTDSAIRITHIPTGIVVECQDERSQHKNKSKAIAVLKSRIHAKEICKREKKKAVTRKNLLGTGDRSDRNRTYNFSQSRITDHRINFTSYQLNEVLSGKLDLLIKPIKKEYQKTILLESKKENENF